MENRAEPLVLLSVSSFGLPCDGVLVVITLLSDFGLTDGYVAQMKASILNTCPEAVVIDISHNISHHNIIMGSFVLETTAPFFSAATIHVAVVDPGVGGKRKPVVIQCAKGMLVGPDNGILAKTSDKLGFKAAFRIKSTGTISRTFHGRDLFAVAAGRIANGEWTTVVGEKISKIVRLKMRPVRKTKNSIEGIVQHIDHFGNIVLNISDLEKLPFSRTGVLESGGSKKPLVSVGSYSDIQPGGIAVLKGSQGYYEIAAREENAARLLHVKPMDPVVIRSS